ncbi:MAG: hypothetical protein ACYDH9_14965 [Limisphaerales bacterium]
MNPLEWRKQLLIAESEMNRAQLSQEWRTMAHEVRDLGQRAKTIGAWASSAALVLAGVAALRKGPPAPAAEKASWFQAVLKAVQVAGSIWLAFLARSPSESK